MRAQEQSECGEFESIYEPEGGRWTLRWIRVERPTIAAPTATLSSPPTPLELLAPSTSRICAPSSLVIPMRTGATLESDVLDVTAAFLLLHVDGHSTIAEIASYTERPLAEVSSAFALLAAMGIIELIGSAPSGVRLLSPTVRPGSSRR